MYIEPLIDKPDSKIARYVIINFIKIVNTEINI